MMVRERPTGGEIVQPVSVDLKPDPEMVTVVPGRTPNGGKPEIGVRTIFASTVKAGPGEADGSPCVPVTITL
jgi:hypothetical protein